MDTGVYRTRERMSKFVDACHNIYRRLVCMNLKYERTTIRIRKTKEIDCIFERLCVCVCAPHNLCVVPVVLRKSRKCEKWSVISGKPLFFGDICFCCGLHAKNFLYMRQMPTGPYSHGIRKPTLSRFTSTEEENQDTVK